jgi:glycine/D-amino acid oxidase-like deaminating enzyme/nitrite reductase/ring-hydroxylating ferredoxin subunit
VDAPRLNRSFWLDSAETDYAPPTATGQFDVAVIGAGITGATTALLLKQAGLTVALLEANCICHGATGYTTAKLTLGHSTIYGDLVDSFGVDVARGYASSNQHAIDEVETIVRKHEIDCDFEHASNYVYTEEARSVRTLEREVEAACSAGVDAELTTETDLPYPVAGAVRVDGQAQFHPWKYVAALARLVDGDGSRVHELTRATNVSSGTLCDVETNAGTVRARHVVIATQLPFLDRALFFAKAHPARSYVVATPIDDERAPRGMYISIDRPTRSVRTTPGPDGRRILIVGGEGHRPGSGTDTEERYRKLESFGRERFGVDAFEYRWSTHDYVPLDKLPYIGRLRRGDDRLFVATGFAKWGMTKGTLAAVIIRDAVLGRANEWADLYDAQRIDLRRSARTLAVENAKVASRFAVDRVRPRPGREDVERLAPGEGTVARVGGRHYAVYRDDAGKLEVLSARCTHLGCIVGWSQADRAWECPCHGSRFAADGTLVQGPATSDLPRVRLPE